MTFSTENKEIPISGTCRMLKKVAGVSIPLTDKVTFTSPVPWTFTIRLSPNVIRRSPGYSL
jgi:hypothetical protein